MNQLAGPFFHYWSLPISFTVLEVWLAILIKLFLSMNGTEILFLSMMLVWHIILSDSSNYLFMICDISWWPRCLPMM
jgi:hypothetical protein